MLIILVITVVFLSSYINGPARHAGYNCSGSETGSGNPTGCSTGNCHGNTATATVTVTIQLDSAGVPVTKYKPGQTYRVKITGVNGTANTLPDFGFQLTAITGSAPSASPVNAGTWQQSGLPPGVQYSAASPGNYLANVIEHSAALVAASGTGTAGTIYTDSVNWTAPAAGTGTISFWGVINCVTGFDFASGITDRWNTQNLIVQEDTSTTTTGINAINGNMHLSIYPNPATDFVQVELANATPGSFLLNAFDARGRKVLSSTLQTTGSYTTTSINTSNWAIGIYMIQLTSGDEEQVVRVVKK